MKLVREWFSRTFSDQQVVILVVLLILGFLIIWLLGRHLAPLFAALILAYLMEGLVAKMQRMKVPRIAAVTTVYLLFIITLLLLAVGLLPRLSQQVQKFIRNIPENVEKVQAKIDAIREKHPELFIQSNSDDSPFRRMGEIDNGNGRLSQAPGMMTQESSAGLLILTEGSLQSLAEQVAPLVADSLKDHYPAIIQTNETPTSAHVATAEEAANEIASGKKMPSEEEGIENVFRGFISDQFINDLLAQLGQAIGRRLGNTVSLSVAAGTTFVMVLVYLILVPMLVLFFLKDKGKILFWSLRFLPKDRSLATQVWREVDQQIGNYVRGKSLEILIVWACTYLVLKLLKLDYAMLLAVFVGLSVLVPYIGATVMTLPIAAVAFFQYGTSSLFWWVLGAYGAIQLIDGNVLAPLMLSEVTNLHPVAVISAVLVFGGLWGLLGVFFAIPLATLVQAVLEAWPTTKKAEQTTKAIPEPG